MENQELAKRQQAIADFITFEAETSIIWPWAIPAEKLLQSTEKLQNVAMSVHFDADDSYDTDELCEELNRTFGVNPVLIEQESVEQGFTSPTM